MTRTILCLYREVDTVGDNPRNNPLVMAWPLLREALLNVIQTQIWQQLVFPQETKLWSIRPRSSSCWLTSPFCLFRWDLHRSKKWGLFSYGGLHGNRVERWNENMAISNPQNMHVAGSCLLTFRPLALLWPHCQGKWFVNVGSLGSLCVHVSQKQPIYFRCFVCSCGCYLSLLFFSFLFLLLLFNIIKTTNMTHYSVLISSEIWQLLVVG